MEELHSIFDLAGRFQGPQFDLHRRYYSVSHLPATALTMNDPAWRQASTAFGVERGHVQNQHIVSVRDLHLGNEALFNPLRANRVKTPSGSSAADLIDKERILDGCTWCDREHDSEFIDAFGAVRSADGRILGHGNWARSSPISGVVRGDETMHNLLRLSKPDFVSLFKVAEQYMIQARNLAADARFFLCFLNGGPKSAAGVPHCHLQVLGRADRQFGYAETVRLRCPPDYWARLESIHESLGLRLSDGASTAWVNIAPVKERDFVITSPDIETGASFVFELLQVLYRNGTNNFTLAAIPSPDYLTGKVGASGFQGSPSVLWRLIDRGDVRARHSDIGGAELFGSAIIATDPWAVMRWFRPDGSGLDRIIPESRSPQIG